MSRNKKYESRRRSRSRSNRRSSSSDRRTGSKYRPKRPDNRTQDRHHGNQKHRHNQRSTQDHGSRRGQTKHDRREDKAAPPPAPKKLGPEFVEEELSRWRAIQQQPADSAISFISPPADTDEQIRLENEAMERREREEAERLAAQREWIDSLKRTQQTQQADIEGPTAHRQPDEPLSPAVEDADLLEGLSASSEAFQGVQVDQSIAARRKEEATLLNNPENSHTKMQAEKPAKSKDMFNLDSDSDSESDGQQDVGTGRQLDFDDEEQYYRTQPGELLHNGEFKVLEQMGKGMYGTVLRATQIQSQSDVAIKVDPY